MTRSTGQDYCPVCGRLTALTVDGRFFRHGPKTNLCRWSGRAPRKDDR